MISSLTSLQSGVRRSHFDAACAARGIGEPAPRPSIGGSV